MPESIPRLGLGTYQNTDPEECAESVRHALELGYRHVDTAQMYNNERYVGEGIARADVPREEVFVASKLLPSNLSADDVLRTTRESLDRLGLDQLDLMYVHWPRNAYDPDETLPALDELVEQGLTRHIGLSNFTPQLLDEARARLDNDILAHQVEMHPLLHQEELQAYAREHGHWLVAYSPLAKMEVADVPEVVEVAEKHDATPAQVSLAWLLSKEQVAAIPKATGEHIDQNYAALDLELDEGDLARIDSIDREKRLVRPTSGPWAQ